MRRIGLDDQEADIRAGGGSGRAGNDIADVELIVAAVGSTGQAVADQDVAAAATIALLGSSPRMML